MTEPVVVVGAGPGGLAVAAALGRRGISAVVLERDAVGASWRRHYDRLHLHTTRRLSGLPGSAIPRRYGRWVARDDVVAYLEAYTVHHDLQVRTGEEVARVDSDAAGGWLVRLADGRSLHARDVVVATGYNHTPALASWPGLDSFTGELLHACRYRESTPYRGRDVLVVGAGNTGAEIAVDLSEGGARRVRLSIRTPPHVVRRSRFGWAAQQTGILVRHLPDAVVDRLARVVARLEIPDLAARGLPRPSTGLATRVRSGALPVQDVGLVSALRTGAVEVVAAMIGMDGPLVLLKDGTRIDPEVVIAATGYRPGLEGLVGHLGVLDHRGVPRAIGGVPALPGLWFTGYTNPISGMLRELRIDAERIARAIRRGHPPVARRPTPVRRRRPRGGGGAVVVPAQR